MDHKRFRVPNNGKFSLTDVQPGNTDGFKSKREAEKLLAENVEALSEVQSVLYAQNRYGVLVIFQGMDTAGKDGAVKHVLTGVNPQGVEVHNFRAPSAEELQHDYLWRCSKLLPEIGRIGIFNRSYYEEVAIVRVHADLLQKERLPKKSMTKNLWKERFEDINNFEKYLSRNGIVVLKFFLHISKEEQKKRLLARIDERDKNYKITPDDIREREYWKEYMFAYEAALANTSTTHAPWYVIPSDHKWFTRVLVADILVNTLKSLDIEYPSATAESERLCKEAKKALLAE